MKMFLSPLGMYVHKDALQQCSQSPFQWIAPAEVPKRLLSALVLHFQWSRMRRATSHRSHNIFRSRQSGTELYYQHTPNLLRYVCQRCTNRMGERPVADPRTECTVHVCCRKPKDAKERQSGQLTPASLTLLFTTDHYLLRSTFILSYFSWCLCLAL